MYLKPTPLFERIHVYKSMSCQGFDDNNGPNGPFGEQNAENPVNEPEHTFCEYIPRFVGSKIFG